MTHLKHADLLRRQAYIDGAWVNADSGKSFTVTNPADGSVIAEVPDMGRAEAKRAIDAAHAAWPAWAGLTAKQRAALLRKWYELILQHQDDLGALMTLEQGKPLAEAKGEVVYGASFVEWFAEEGRRIYGDVIPAHAPDKRIVVVKQPIGVVAAITPWNFPVAMITRKVAPALAAGCPVVVKPAEDTPLCALALARLAEEAGIPKGVFNVVTTVDGPGVGIELTTNPKVRKVSFTGSTEVGKILMRQSADTLKKLSLELGGNAPFIVFDDADIDAAIAGAMVSKYRNTGQTCVCANRLFVQDGIYDAFAAKLAEAVKKLKTGPGFTEGVNQGPLINQDALDKVERLVGDAKAKGAKVLVGGAKHDLGGTFYQPSVITEATTAMACAQEEIFGPVAVLFRFKDEADAIRLANDTPYGLAAYFYSRDVGRAWRVAEKLEYGIVGINEGLISTAEAPFGGVKESGMGREGSKYGVDSFVEIKYLCFGGV
ncbi:MAG: NAD-dependent succinate-semialdehyde dehydrogenase [Ferrovibrio sp.]|uniref:NAD-dependent succinate-semialdehyde dehydrogenase n=1 Tax=Ferrovibrio sp. TaxID=1917215 RepID=UPI00391C47E4